MKHWLAGTIGRGYGDHDGIILRGDDDDRVISLAKLLGQVIFTEECDGYFTTILSEEQAIEALQEAIDWIKK